MQKENLKALDRIAKKISDAESHLTKIEDSIDDKKHRTAQHETIKDIKSKFRLFMNGMVSQSMREKGMEYKLNFGIEYPRIKEIAAGYEPDHELAQALWKENIRECKILAGLLQPADTFYQEIADIWI